MCVEHKECLKNGVRFYNFGSKIIVLIAFSGLNTTPLEIPYGVFP